MLINNTALQLYTFVRHCLNGRWESGRRCTIGKIDSSKREGVVEADHSARRQVESGVVVVLKNSCIGVKLTRDKELQRQRAENKIRSKVG